MDLTGRMHLHSQILFVLNFWNKTNPNQLLVKDNEIND